MVRCLDENGTDIRNNRGLLHNETDDFVCACMPVYACVPLHRIHSLWQRLVRNGPNLFECYVDDPRLISRRLRTQKHFRLSRHAQFSGLWCRFRYFPFGYRSFRQMIGIPSATALTNGEFLKFKTRLKSNFTNFVSLCIYSIFFRVESTPSRIG